jgi:uncharacterized protein YciW
MRQLLAAEIDHSDSAVAQLRHEQTTMAEIDGHVINAAGHAAERDFFGKDERRSLALQLLPVGGVDVPERVAHGAKNSD